MPTIERTVPITHSFADDGTIPNNPALPFVLYRNGIDLAGSPDPEKLIEKTFADNGWGEIWRNGIYRYPHYHLCRGSKAEHAKAVPAIKKSRRRPPIRYSDRTAR